MALAAAFSAAFLIVLCYDIQIKLLLFFFSRFCSFAFLIQLGHMFFSVKDDVTVITKAFCFHGLLNGFKPFHGFT